ncbi:MAG: hypothetical protein IK014_06680 [Lachnospiraceae bacterium]|nr:hypothetical protein [Lachnospiraceae bacterium]
MFDPLKQGFADFYHMTDMAVFTYAVMIAFDYDVDRREEGDRKKQNGYDTGHGFLKIMIVTHMIHLPFLKIR